MHNTPVSGGFNSLGLPKPLLERLSRLGFVTPTPIQAAAIQPASKGRDLVGIAQTGTGKTLAFGLPIAARLQPGQIALILAPTRELAQQIRDTFHALNLRTALLIGGAPMGRQISELRARPSVIVATPGRLLDHLSQRTLDLRRAAIVVLDEADRMLDMGFAPDIRRILDQCPRERQTMLFSATMPSEIEDMANRYLRDPQRIEVERSQDTADLIEQELVIIPHEEKPAMLGELLADHRGTILVFARTRHGARKLARAVRGLGHSAAELHSDRTLAQRREALHGFKTGAYRVLVATDIAARGIDVKDIALVVNYDVPEKPEDYVHRVGRTGRAGSFGKAITLATPEQRNDVRDIERLLRSEIALSSRSNLRFTHPPSRAAGSRPRQARRGPRARHAVRA